MTVRLEKFYKEEVVPKLMEKFGYANVMQVPRLTKVTLNMGVVRRWATRRSWKTPLPT